MLRPREVLIWALLASWALCLGSANEVPPADAGTIGAGKGRRLQGRFLHITDFHPDPFYKTYSSTLQNAACHRERGPAGYYGAETSACDSSIALVNATMDWIRDNIADRIDFVIWTGDSARHDNDEKVPRTPRQIVQQNKFMVEKMTAVFGEDEKGAGVKVVPTIGNNDVMPHNILLAGPNKWTKKYLDIWRPFIPEEQRHQFQQGGWYWVEVVPNKLAVVSLNTMYLFSSNSGVDGCAKKHEPGFEQFEWLRIQLQLMRDRGVSAILIGHVPPARVDSKESWDETCWQKFALWGRQYRDVIVASFFGHMNLDHFMLQDFKQIKKKTKNGVMTSSSGSKNEQSGVSFLEEGEVTVASASDYLLDLREAWAKLPALPSSKGSLSIADYLDSDDDEDGEVKEGYLSSRQKFLSNSKKPAKNETRDKGGKSERKLYLEKIGGKYAERYSASLVSPSIVPNFFPTLRIVEYNITGLEDTLLSTAPFFSPGEPEYPLVEDPTTENEFPNDEAYMREVETAVKNKKKKKEKEALKKPKKHKFKVPKGPSKSAPPGPGYSPQPLTLTGYVQYFANLTYINNDFLVEPEDGSSSQSVFGLEVSKDGEIEPSKWKEGKHGKHQGKKPRPKPHPNKFGFEVEYDTRTDDGYQLRDLTVRSIVDLARRIAHDSGASQILKDDEDIFDSEETEKADEVSDDEDEDEAEDEKTTGKEKKGKKGKTDNRTWFTFVQRAFVGTMDPHSIGLVFGAREHAGNAGQHVNEKQEIMEL